VASAPLEEFGGLSLAQLGLGFGVYAWVGYYACCFLPYRMLYDEYQGYERRVAQVRGCSLRFFMLLPSLVLLLVVVVVVVVVVVLLLLLLLLDQHDRVLEKFF